MVEGTDKKCKLVCILLCRRALLDKIDSGGYTGNNIQLRSESLNRGRESELREETLVNRQRLVN